VTRAAAAFFKQLADGLQGFWQVFLERIFRVFLDQVYNVLIADNA
jgi:hypothetical protein